MIAEDIDRVRVSASVFRRAIERCKRNLTYIAFKQFPCGSCGDACDLLGRFFEERGIDGWTCVSGHRGEDTHAWLEKDGLIVDITADQFADSPGSVIVASDGSWHHQFVVVARRPVGATLAMPETQGQLDKTYQMILSYIGIHENDLRES